MDAKSLKKLNRRELLEVMVKISEENEELSRENEELKAELENRKLSAKEVGSLAQASLEANNYFVAAENAAKLYLENIVRIERETKERSSKLLEETLADCINKRAEAGFSAEQLIPPSWGAAGSIEMELAQDAQKNATPAKFESQAAESAEGSTQEEIAVSPEGEVPAETLPGLEAGAEVVAAGEDTADVAEAAPKKEKKGLFGRKKKSS